MESSPYRTYDDIKICDVYIPKGTGIMVDIGKVFNKDQCLIISIAACHHNPTQWHEPAKFIPERFDPTSEYFTKPGTNEQRDSTAFIPFSTGSRGCPAMMYAVTQVKTLLAYFLSRVEYTIDEEYMNNPHVYFGLESVDTLEGTIIRKFHN